MGTFFTHAKYLYIFILFLYILQALYKEPDVIFYRFFFNIASQIRFVQFTFEILFLDFQRFLRIS